MKLKEKPEERVWHDFQKEMQVTPEQLDQFQRYAHLLLSWNETHNLTAITNFSGVANQHFIDSLALTRVYDLNKIAMIVDAGAGAGFPGIPLKIMYPHLKMILIEVTHKKQLFLEEVVRQLNLDNIEISGLDWRTFVRTTEAPVDLFISRAALSDIELTRIFRTTSVYRDATLIYWASAKWECAEKVKKYLKQEIEYQVKNTKRKLAIFKNI